MSIPVTMFVLTAGGASGQQVGEVLDHATKISDRMLREQSFFKKWVVARLSISLVRYASRLHYLCLKATRITG